MRLPIILCMVAVTMAEISPEYKLITGSESFSGKLFAAVAKQQQGKSVVVSGFSALSPVAQLALGSVGAAHDEAFDAFGMAKEGDGPVKIAFEMVNKRLSAIKSVELKVANSVYFPKGTKLNGTFAKMSKEVFSSNVQDIDFSNNAKAAADINGWVEDHTNHRIKDLVSQNDFSKDTKVVVVNAIYFQGTWKNTFDKQSTEDQDFHVSKHKTVKVPTMFQNNHFKYAQSQNLQAKVLELPYKGGDSSMLIVLPDEVDGLGALLQKLENQTALDEATSDFEEAPVDVYLPKFKIETKVDLTDVLQNVGVQKLFSRDSRLDYVFESPNDLFVDKAVQKAFFEVTEEGVEAAAASVVEGVGAMAPWHIKEFRADRPFFFALQAKQVTLFTGVYYG